MDINIPDFVDKLIILEKNIGNITNFKILNPFYFENDILGINKAAKNIADFIGLINFTFIVSSKDLKSKTAGEIEARNYDNNVFIELSVNSLEFIPSILAILSHEITHKLLSYNNISLPINHQNEVLTDIASIYIGLGKLVLEGLETKKTKTMYDNQTIKTNEKLYKVGYLTKEELSFVYLLICTMRNISQENIYSNLSENTVNILQKISIKFDDYLSYHYHNCEHNIFLKDKSINRFQEIQKYIFEIEKLYVYNDYLLSNIKTEFAKHYHKIIKEKQIYINNNFISDINPSLNYLYNIRNEILTDSILAELEDFDLKYDEIKNIFLNILKQSNLSDKEPNKDIESRLEIITCGNCGKQMKIPVGKTIKIKCKDCHYEFVADIKFNIDKYIYSNYVDIKHKSSKLKKANPFKKIIKKFRN